MFLADGGQGEQEIIDAVQATVSPTFLPIIQTATTAVATTGNGLWQVLGLGGLFLFIILVLFLIFRSRK